MNSHAEVEMRQLRLLVVEDDPNDALLLMRTLKKGGILPAYLRVETPDALREALETSEWDIVISDYTMPEFSGLQALAIVKQHDSGLPFIIVSGNIGEDVAVGAMRSGAQDYLLKNNLTRLVPAIAREMNETEARRHSRETEEALHRNQERLMSILGSLGDIVWSIGLPGLRMEYLNDAAEIIYGRPVAELFGNQETWLSTIHPEDRDRMRDYVGNTVASGSNSAEYRILRPDGEVRWLFDRSRLILNERGRKVRVDGIASDITQYKQQQDMLYQAAHHDALTGLPNRSLMLERLQRTLARHARGGEALAILFIDIDRFKTINDSLGHKVGDQVLCEVARRLGEALRVDDAVGRLGGDEFVVLLPHMASDGHAAGVAQKLIQAIAPPS